MSSLYHGDKDVSNVTYLTPSLGRKEKKNKQKTPKYPKPVETRCVPNVRLFYVALFPFESSHFETVYYLEFQMAKLRNQIIKQKILVLNYDKLRHFRVGV